MSTRFYVSARFGRQAEARDAADQITEATGWSCTAGWLDATPEDDVEVHRRGALMQDAALQDLADIDRADVMFCLTEDLSSGDHVPAGWARGGRHVEVGYAIARGRNGR